MKEHYGGIDVLVNNAAIAFKNSATEPFALQVEPSLLTPFSNKAFVSHEF